MLSKDLDDALVRDFPNTFRDRHASVMNTPMGFGFECGDGWEPLIRTIASELEAFILTLPEERGAYVRAAQVKEKYGGLRFYVDTDADIVDGEWLSIDLPEHVTKTIREAEDASLRTCEVCGADGSTRESQGWVTTRCALHA